MSVYIEYVFIDNIVINCLILLCVKKTLKLRSGGVRIFLSALVGTIAALALPLLKLNNLFALPIKIVLGAVMLLILAKFYKMKEFIFAYLLFFAYTLLLGGACFATLLVLGCDLNLIMAGGYDAALPLGIILFIVSLYVALIVGVAKYLSRRRIISPFVRKVVLCLAEYQLKLTAFIDSGNKLVDSRSGMPVIIVSCDALQRCFNKEQLDLLFEGKDSKLFKGVHSTNYNTISGEAKSMVIFNADKLVIINEGREYTTNRFVVGVTNKKFKDAIDYQMLLSPSVL